MGHGKGSPANLVYVLKWHGQYTKEMLYGRNVTPAKKKQIEKHKYCQI